MILPFPILCYFLCCYLCFYIDIDYALHTQYILRTDVLLFVDTASCPQVHRETDLIHTDGGAPAVVEESESQSAAQSQSSHTVPISEEREGASAPAPAPPAPPADASGQDVKEPINLLTQLVAAQAQRQSSGYGDRAVSARARDFITLNPLEFFG